MTRLVLAVLLLLLAAARPAAALEVVATIKPLQSLAAAVMAGAGTPRLLVDGAFDPHSYALRPSDARALMEAAVVVRVGAGLDSFADKVLRGQRAGTVVTFATLPGVTRLPLRRGGLWEGDGHDHGAATDPHVWLDPLNAKVLASALAEALAAADPAQAALYRGNALALQERLDLLDGEVGMLLRPVRGIPYLVFHDAFQYLEARYRLAPVGSVSLDPERPPGARRLASLRQRIEDGGVACLFRQPQFSPRLVDSLAAGLPVRVAVLDDLGAELPPGPEQYESLLRSLARSLRDCLAGVE